MESSEPEYKKYLQLITRRKELFVVLALVLMTVVFVVSFLLPRKYESSSTVFVEKNVISELVKGITVTPSMETTQDVITYTITSRALIMKVVDALDLNLGRKEADTEELIKTLQHNTKVKVKEKNSLFIISFADKDPRVARDYVNTLVRFYIEQNISSKRGESYDATKFLSEQIDSFRVKLDKAEQQINVYKRQNGGVISIDEGKLFEEINIAQQKLYDLQLRRRHLEGMRQVTRRSSDTTQQMKLVALKRKLDDLRVQYTDSYPEVATVKAEIEAVKDQMKARKGGEMQPLDPQELEKIESEIAALKVTEEGMHRYITTNKTLLQTIPSAKAGLEKLELEAKNQKNIYDQLVSRHGQSEVSKQMEVQDKSTTFRVVDPAVFPVKPSSPKRLQIMLMGIFAGLAVSFGVLFLLDRMDASVKGVDSVREFEVPVLATIPRMEDPVLSARQRARSLRIFSACAVYFLLMLVFPVMELLELPYMDRLLDSIKISLG